MAQYTNGFQRPVKPNVGGLLLLAGLENEVTSDFCLASFPTISQEKYLEKKSILNQPGSSSKIEN